MSLPIFIALVFACGSLHLAAAQPTGSCYDNTISSDPAAQTINATASSLYAVATPYVAYTVTCFHIPMSGYAVIGGNKVVFSGVPVRVSQMGGEGGGGCLCLAEGRGGASGVSHTVHIQYYYHINNKNASPDSI